MRVYLLACGRLSVAGEEDAVFAKCLAILLVVPGNFRLKYELICSHGNNRIWLLSRS